MKHDSDEDLAAEEHKRERNWDPQQRWQTLQATIMWADGQSTVRRNSPESCHRVEQMLNRHHAPFLSPRLP